MAGLDKHTAAGVRQAAMERFPMDLGGIHGIAHWERVRENGLFLAKHSGGNPVVAELFAYLHDCCRESNGSDPQHGPRASEFAASIRGIVFALQDDEFDLLQFACEKHEKGLVSDDPTVGACWNSDRLDLGRVGIYPNPQFLSTLKAKEPPVIEWGYERSCHHATGFES